MNTSELQVGKIYVVAGRGPMQLASTTPNSLKFLTHGGFYLAWVSREDVVRECDAELLAKYDAEERDRGLECKEPNCWCRRAT